MKRIRSKDEVIVVAGKDKGKQGTVQQVLTNGKVVVSGVNVAKKHTKPDPNRDIVGGIVDKEMPLDISNVALYNKETNKKDKVVFKIDEKSKKKIRCYKSTGKEVA